MSSWWNLGEHSGQFGDRLALYQIECPFCSEKGNYKRVFRAEKQKPNGSKTLFFDTYECGNCSGYVQVVWSLSEHGPHQGMHDYVVQPWPKKVGDGSDNWPESVKRTWRQAHNSLNNEDYDAAAVMARSALQAVLRDQIKNRDENEKAQPSGKKRMLYEEIEKLAEDGVLPDVITEWSHEVRLLAKPAAHPDDGEQETSPEDAEDIIKFLDYLLEYVYDLPAKIEQYRKRREESDD